MKQNFFRTRLLPIIVIISGIILLSLASLSHIFIVGFIGLFHNPYVIFNDTKQEVMVFAVKSSVTPLEEKMSTYILAPEKSMVVSENVNCIFMPTKKDGKEVILGWSLQNQPYTKIAQAKKILNFFPAPRLHQYTLSQFVEGKNECGYKLEDVIK